MTFSTSCSYPSECFAGGGSGGGTGSYPPGSVFCNGTPTVLVDVTNPIKGKHGWTVIQKLQEHLQAILILMPIAIYTNGEEDPIVISVEINQLQVL